ncbi:LytTR family DNA-binding domain-containing protein [Paludibacterium sp. B53371]|uniref:LytR/AlgR family response regulator transcription factor n=1 Tax=Paludibacterium sp. B53371 TaxID=2806263 RepID=UPI001C04A50B|nr:LytTR family DNA-binding domain-containing protein [Paludibacterium sp. B53371]
MPTALIADDEPRLAEDLQRRLAALWPDLHIVAMAANGVEALAAMAQHQPDIAFLDIHMPGLTGLQVAATARDCRVVFVTAYDQYALAAFEAAAVDYLLKPVSELRLAQCVSRLQQHDRPRPDWSQLASALPAANDQALRWLTVGQGQTTRLVAVDEVLYFRASDKYTEVITAHECHLIRTPLKALLAQLPSGRFSQIHRSVIVCLAAVERLERDVFGRVLLHLKQRPETLPVSRAYVAQFRQM